MSYRYPDHPGAGLPDGGAAEHPSAARLAALADERPTAAEALHLAGCPACRQEVAALRSIVAAARERRDQVLPPLTRWDDVAAALRAEGLVRAGEAGPVAQDDPAPVGAQVLPLRPPAARRAGRPAVWLRRAAALLLVAGGGLVVGRLSAGAAPVPGLALGAPAAAPVTVEGILADTATTPASMDEAMAILTRAERDYRVATAYLADETRPSAGALDEPEMYQRRLAVMDEVAALTRAALSDAPHDPVLNQYYLASLGAREATLRHLATSLPVGAQLSRF